MLRFSWHLAMGYRGAFRTTWGKLLRRPIGTTCSVIMRTAIGTVLLALTILSLVMTFLVTATPAATSALVPSPAAEPTGRSGATEVDAAKQRSDRDEKRLTSMVSDAGVKPPRARVEPTARPAIRVESPAEEPETPLQLVALAPLTVDVWNAEERYFTVSGETPDLIVASANASIPSDPSGAARHSMAYAGPTVWEHQPSYVIDASTGRCTMTGVASMTLYQATVPQWTSPSNVPPELLRWWQVVLEHIRQHEGAHIRIFADFVSILPDRVAGQPCSSWDAIVNAWSADLVSAQAAFDAVEEGWGLPVYAGPLDW